MKLQKHTAAEDEPDRTRGPEQKGGAGGRDRLRTTRITIQSGKDRIRAEPTGKAEKTEKTEKTDRTEETTEETDKTEET